MLPPYYFAVVLLYVVYLSSICGVSHHHGRDARAERCVRSFNPRSVFALLPGETDKNETLAGIFCAVRPGKALGQRTGRMSVGDDSGSPPLME